VITEDHPPPRQNDPASAVTADALLHPNCVWRVAEVIDLKLAESPKYLDFKV